MRMPGIHDIERLTYFVNRKNKVARLTFSLLIYQSAALNNKFRRIGTLQPFTILAL